MSAYMVSNDLIDLIVSIGMIVEPYCRPTITAPGIIGEPVTMRLADSFEMAYPQPGGDYLVSPTDVGLTMLNANLSAMLGQYGARLGDDFDAYVAQVDRYEWRPVPIDELPGAEANVLTALSSYEYQVCELKHWEAWDAAKWCAQFRALAAIRLARSINARTGLDAARFDRATWLPAHQ